MPALCGGGEASIGIRDTTILILSGIILFDYFSYHGVHIGEYLPINN